MSSKRPVILSHEETERLIEIIRNLRRIQAITGSCLESMTDLVAEAAEIGRRHGIPALSVRIADDLPTGTDPSDTPLSSYLR